MLVYIACECQHKPRIIGPPVSDLEMERADSLYWCVLNDEYPVSLTAGHRRLGITKAEFKRAHEILYSQGRIRYMQRGARVVLLLPEGQG